MELATCLRNFLIYVGRFPHWLLVKWWLFWGFLHNVMKVYCKIWQEYIISAFCWKWEKTFSERRKKPRNRPSFAQKVTFCCGIQLFVIVSTKDKNWNLRNCFLNYLYLHVFPHLNRSHDIVQPSFELISSVLYSNWIPGHYSLIASN
jgi:hypothetical protein